MDPWGLENQCSWTFFYDHAQVSKKKRFHFHSFMAHVHNKIHDLKQNQLKQHGRNFAVDTNPDHNPIRQVAILLAGEMSLLCLDEFQVTDIADALILSQLFETFWGLGTVVVATSNRLPLQLYEGGLNRSYFLPFISLLERHCIVHSMKSSMDYRVALSDDSFEKFFLSSEYMSENDFSTLVDELRQDNKPVDVEAVLLKVGKTRQLRVERGDANGRVGHFRFGELCDMELGASDYRAVAQHFDIVAIQDIPTLSLEDHNRARRFVTLIDELYEAKTTALLCLAEEKDDPFELFQGRRIVAPTNADEDTPGIDEAQAQGKSVGASASVRELSFAFNRAASRLVEMTSRRWWDLVLKREI
mmetsp:Transcript_17978/g.23238  ORF Transcript_17978/g.23238 Transcript_17978/m.23238 type:complete len:359 (+) Transcript_17978:619-1695(+)